jgi:SAM-dependent methyltransferase
MRQIRPELVDHPDRLRWNIRYGAGFTPSFTAHPLAVRALSMRLPAGPVLDLACGPSGSALLAAASGRPVTAVDASEVALGLLGEEARRRGLGDLVTLIHADLGTWRPDLPGYPLVLCTGYWDRDVFAAAAGAVTGGGLIAWEALTDQAQRLRPGLPALWCVGPGEPACLLPPGFDVLDQHDAAGQRSAKRQLLARRRKAAATVPALHEPRDDS